MHIHTIAYAFAIFNCAAVDLHFVMIRTYVPTVTDNSKTPWNTLILAMNISINEAATGACAPSWDIVLEMDLKSVNLGL